MSAAVTGAHEKPLASRVLVIGHRGAPALRPEHTLASYGRAIADGADFIEPDLVMSRDGVLVARHENEISGTTDVAAHAAFAGRETSKSVDGQMVRGWFTEDFSLAELKTLRARERLPQLRSTRHDGEFEIATMEEIIAFVAAQSALVGRPIGIIPEIKHGTYFQQCHLPMEDTLLTTLAAHPYTRMAPVEIQSFEVANLKYLHQQLGDDEASRKRSNIRLLQLIDDPAHAPWDVLDQGGSLTYAQMTTPAGLRAIAAYADAIGPGLEAIIPRDQEGRLASPTRLVHDAHGAGLEVHAYTFRPENLFLAREFRLGDDPAVRHEAGAVAHIRRYLDAGIDAFFTDDPAIGRVAVDGR